MNSTLITRSGVQASVLGESAARLPVGGKIRAGIKVLTRQAAELSQAQALYEQGVASGQSFDEIEAAIVAALPTLKHPLVPRNVPWFIRENYDAAVEVAHETPAEQYRESLRMALPKSEILQAERVVAQS